MGTLTGIIRAPYVEVMFEDETMGVVKFKRGGASWGIPL
jgi:hypothetical protein